MKTKVGEYKGYKFIYDTDQKTFAAENPQGEEVGTGKTQDEIEKLIDADIKQRHKFPITVIKSTYNSLTLGKITSMNLSDGTFWFVSEQKERSKESVRYGSNFYLANETNLAIVAKVQELRKQIDALEKEIRETKMTLTEPITQQYFGIERR
jgi:hypothetical protein